MLIDKDKDVYNVYLNGNSVGFFQGDTWGEAQRKCASFYNEDKDKEDRISWEHFYALWVNPKYYDQYGIASSEE
jgi:hypothetical protein